MKRFLLLLLIAGIVLLVVLFVRRPELLDQIWIWLIGFSAAIIRIVQLAAGYLKKIFSNDATSVTPVTPATEPVPQDQFAGSTIKVVRISDDGETSTGLLFVNDRFFCYTLEDAHQEVKIPGQTRIPAGTYSLDFNRQKTEKTIEYQTKYPDWFTYHLEIKNVPDFTSVYIHNGGSHLDTEGCILVSDSIQAQDQNTLLTNSRTTFKRLYQFISLQLNEGIPYRIIITDEQWIKAIKP